MNSEKIQNTKVEVPKGKNLNCKDYMNMLLTILKEEVMNKDGFYEDVVRLSIIK